MPTVRIVVRTLIACVLASLGTGIAGPALAAQVTPAAQGRAHDQESARMKQASSSGLSIAIDSLSSRVARPGSTIVVKGTITNHTGGPLSSVQVQLETSSAYFPSRSQMTEYLAGSDAYFLYASLGAGWGATSTLHNGSTMTWTASFQVSSAGYAKFGVYPLVAQAMNAYVPQASARTFLPYWDSKEPPSRKLDIAWIWPLIDQPQQGTCRRTLSTSQLAASFAPGGRLNGLLTTGLQYSGSTHLTWAVDPALLSDATVMTQRYKVGVGNALCTGTTGMPASAAAASWLSQLRTGAAGDPMFVTPYADPDVSALTHAGLDAEISRAYTVGNQEAAAALHRSFGQSPSATGQGAAQATIAWPEGGMADASVLTSLARHGQAGTTVLSSDLMPLVPGVTFLPDNAIAQAPTGIGTTMNVLLADSGLTSLLASATAGASQGSQFAVTQDFLAETAMITAEAPNSRHSLVVAPPSRWSPSAAEAATLLALTSAPWLRPVPLATLAAQHPSPEAHRKALPPVKVAPGELSANYMSKVKEVSADAGLYSSLLYQPGPDVLQMLGGAVAATESSAWRGKASLGGWTTLNEVGSYFVSGARQVKIIGGNKVLLAGTSGATPVSVFNGLPETVQVQVRALLPPGSQLTIGDFNALITVPSQQIKTVRMPVHSAALGSTMMQLQLVTKEGMPLPEEPQMFSVQSTRFGRALLILIGAALGVLVLTSLARWIRRGFKDGASGVDERSGVSG
jgi:hypothetical protein